MPSWISSVPQRVGASGSGKVKADQWRTLGLIHLPISLAILWRNPDIQKTRLLHITLSLLSAMTVASSHITSRQHAKVYLYYMKQYVEGLKQMFHKFKLHPNHHMALHLQEYLIQYGPVHSWWTFPFERLIGLIQLIPSNGKPGTYAVGSNLSPLITNRLLGEYKESISK